MTINEAVSLLKQGEIVALPTETVYGLAADITNLNSVDKLYQLKGRSKAKPIAIAISQPTDIYPWVKTLEDDAKKLIHHFWPGPLTLVLEGSDEVPAILFSERGGVGLRCSSCALIQQVIATFGHPLALSSANLSGHKDALTAAQVSEYFPQIWVLEADAEVQGLPSTVVELIAKPYRLLRKGAIPLIEIQAVLGSEIVLEE